MVDGGATDGTVNFAGVVAGGRKLHPRGDVGAGIAADTAAMSEEGGCDAQAAGICTFHVVGPVAERTGPAGGYLKVKPPASSVDDIGEAVAELGVEIVAGEALDADAPLGAAEEALLVVIEGKGDGEVLSQTVGAAVSIARHEAL